MKKYFEFANRFHNDEEGATAIEYGLLAALIAVAIIGAVSFLGDEVEGTFEDVATALEGRDDGVE